MVKANDSVVCLKVAKPQVQPATDISWVPDQMDCTNSLESLKRPLLASLVE